MQTRNGHILTLFRHHFRAIAGATALALSLPVTAHAQVDINQILRQLIRDARQQQAHGQQGDACDSSREPAPVPAMPYGRLADPRINHNTIGPYVCRWYLERIDPVAANSDVAHPVTYLIDADVPAEWRPHITQAVHEWDTTFDVIGLRHALAVRVATPKDSVTPPVNAVRIRLRDISGSLIMSTGCTAVPATGQMTGCTIWVNGSAFGEAGRQMCRATVIADPAVPLSCPDSILAYLFRAMVAHEVGHSLGLGHNFYAAGAYPTDSLASAAFLHTWGYTPSIMLNPLYDQYTPPEAHVPHTERWARVGPYDRWAIAWAYRPIPGATSAEAERPTLEQWRAAQDTAAYLRVSVEGAGGDANAVGGDDPVRALEFRARDRVAVWQRKFHEDTANALAKAANRTMPGQWAEELTGLVDAVLGGRRPQPPYPRDRAAIHYAPLAPAQQLRAVRLVLAYAFYGQDPYIRLLQRVAEVHSGTPPAAQDNLPFLVDTAVSGRFPATPAWQHAQQHVLTHLTAAFSKLPLGALPEACRAVATAVDQLTRVESSAASSSVLHAAATMLRTALTPAPGICP